MDTSEEARQKREKQILQYLQQRMKAKAIKAAVKPDNLPEKKAVRNITCTFCRRTILLGTGYVSFKGQPGAMYRGKNLRTEKMHQECLNRYMRPGVVTFTGR